MSIKTTGGHPKMDYPEHIRTYNSFIGWTKFMTVFLVILLASMAYFLTNSGVSH